MEIQKLILYGAGRRCERLCRMLRKTDVEPAALVDSSPKKWGEEVEGYRISAPKVLEEYRDFYFCITPEDGGTADEIRRELQSIYHFRPENEIDYQRAMLQIYVRTYAGSPLICQTGKETDGAEEESMLFDCYNGLVLGGVEAWTMDLCQALIKDGRRNIFIISDKGTYTIPAMLENCILSADIDHRERFLESTIHSLIDVIMKKMPCKVVTCITDEVMLAAYIVKSYYPDKVEIISVLHNSNEGVYREYMAFRDCPDLHIGVSRDIQNDLIERGICPEKTASMTCPFFCEQNLRRSYSEEQSMPVRIGFAGRLEYYQKRMDLMLKLIAELAEKKVDFMMEFAGAGSAQGEMENFVLNNHLDEKVRFLGRIERTEIPDFWKRQDICINMADFEGRSISIIEAMGNGAVPVVTQTSGVREDIVNGFNGYVVPIGDYHAAAECIGHLAGCRERLCEMGRLAHDAVYPKSRMEPHLAFWKKVLYDRERGQEWRELR